MGRGHVEDLGFRRTLVIFIGLQLGQVMSSLDGTIVATALPTIVDDVGGFSRVTWVVSAYSLAMVASMPLYGKLGDLYGRRRILLGAITIFLIGSVACGIAQTMDQLLVARFVQGLGGGGLGAVAMATIADIVPARELGRWLGYQGVIYAVASAVGPIAGGLFVDHLSWRWAFLVNIPVGLLAMAIVATRLRIPERRVEHRLDLLGGALLTSGLALFVLLATLGGHDLPWGSPGTLALAAAVVVLAVAFIARERRAPEPVLPLRLFADPVMRAAAGINFTSGLLLWCGLFFVPLFVQEVSGTSASSSGVVLVPLMFGAAAGTWATGRLVARHGRYRAWPIIGSVLMTVAALGLLALDRSTPVIAAAATVLLLGTGAGFVMQPSLLAAQNAAHLRDLGTATSTALLFRTLGNTVGTPIFGGMLNAGLEGVTRTPTTVADALQPVFAGAVVVGLASIAISFVLPDRPLRDRVAASEELAPATP
jgi:EmrB/QacA subfamily drug resistance transporter